MVKVLEIKKNLTEDEMFNEVYVTEVKYSNRGEEYFVTTFRADEAVDIYVTDNEDVYNRLCVKNFFAEDYEFQDKLDSISLESYHEIADEWEDGSAESIYVNEINYCLYKMEQFMKEESGAEIIENDNLEKIDFIVPSYVAENSEGEGMLLQEYQVCRCDGQKLISVEYFDEDEEVTLEQIEIYDQEVNNLHFNYNLFTLNKEQLDHIKGLIKESGVEDSDGAGIGFMLNKDSLFLLNRSDGNKNFYEEVFTKEMYKLVYDICKYLDNNGYEIYEILDKTSWVAIADKEEK